MILFGGAQQGELRFCNEKCQQEGALAVFATQLPAEKVAEYIDSVHKGNCPMCAGPGPIDVHTSYRIWSAMVLTSWQSRPAVCCRSCGTKRKLGDAAFSMVLGWWGFPWGVIGTPIQLLRNGWGVISPPDPDTPSPALEKIVRLDLAARIAAAHQEEAVEV